MYYYVLLILYPLNFFITINSNLKLLYMYYIYYKNWNYRKYFIYVVLNLNKSVTKHNYLVYIFIPLLIFNTTIIIN